MEGGAVGLAYTIIGYVDSDSNNCKYPIALILLDNLKPHEMVIEERVKMLQESLVREGVQIRPILVDYKTMVILDGHHRVEALRRLGARKVAAVLVDYDSDECIKVGTWREGWVVSKNEVRERGLKGKLYPPRTSRHMPRFKVPEVNVPLNDLLG
ncbi:MAG: ParB N-terminal domain-containing protein [Desulfurococcales archaeon]|nr:ParB N-terminal domain-containing protein [Desulfurococcales archaeon]